MYDEMGFTKHGRKHYDELVREAQAARLREEEAKRARHHAAWVRLCGMLSPIGGMTDV